MLKLGFFFFKKKNQNQKYKLSFPSFHLFLGEPFTSFTLSTGFDSKQQQLRSVLVPTTPFFTPFSKHWTGYKGQCAAT